MMICGGLAVENGVNVRKGVHSWDRDRLQLMG